MATNGNNFSDKYALTRDSFFVDSEKEYFLDLLQSNPIERKLHAKMTMENAERLYKNAMELIEAVDRGEFAQEQMDAIEKIIAHNLAALQDAEMVHEKECFPENI